MSKKQKTTSSQTQNQSFNTVLTPTNPEWVSGGIQELFGDTMKLGNADPASYFAGPDALQTQAGQGAAQLGGGDRSWLDNIMKGSAQNVEAQKVGSESLLTNLDAYMSPYRDQVVNAWKADSDFDADRTRANQTLQMAGEDAFGGSGSAITKSLTEEGLKRARDSGLSNILDSMFNRGAALSADDAGRRQQANIANAGFAQEAATGNANRDLSYQGLQAQTGLGAEASDRANVGTQADIGSMLQALSQQKAGAPLTLQAMLNSMASGLPLNLFSGQTTNGTSNGTSTGTSTTKTSDPMGFITNMAQAAATAYASDERVKQHIETEGYDAKGRRWTTYEYVWEPGKRYRGVIAQEVMKTDPDAVSRHPHGYLMVDYSKLEG